MSTTTIEVGEATLTIPTDSLLHAWLNAQLSHKNLMIALTQTPHTDDAAVDRFSAAMKDKLAIARAKGRSGWEDKTQVHAKELSNMLLEHVQKGDPRDVANFCMFLWERGERITAPAAASVSLRDGEKYAGILLGKDGDPDRHIILLPGDNDPTDWDAQVAWAQSIGGMLPTRRAQALLFANLPEEFQGAWYASCERREGGGAWYQYFDYGYQYWYLTLTKCRARAVRSIVI